MSDLKSRWWPDVRSIEGRRAAAKAGFFAGLGMAVLSLIGLAVLLLLRRSPLDGTAAGSGPDLWGAGGIVVEVAVYVVAALRLRRSKGLVWGSVALVLFLVEVAAKLASGTVSFVILYAVVVLCIVNGLRGAWAERSAVDDTRDTFA